MKDSTRKAGRIAPRIPHEVAALLSALQLTGPDTTPLTELSDEEWASLLAFCDVAHLTLTIAQLPMEGSPDRVRERLSKNVADNAARFERIKAAYREAAQALARAGVEHIVIKGFTQSPDYVADPRFRMQSDIDIFCPPESVHAARCALQAIGYKSDDAKTVPACADHGPALVRLGDSQWKGNPYDAELPLGIELHFCLWNERVSRIRIPEAGQFWERRAVREVEGLSFCCLGPVDHLGHLTLHILRNLFLGDWIVHHVQELAFFLHSHADDAKFWHTWSQTHSPSLRSFEAIAFYHARAWFGCRLPPVAEDEIDRLPATCRSWLERFSGSALEGMFEQNKDYVWLQLTFVSSLKEQWKILRRTMIPARIGSIGSPLVQVRNRRPVQSGSGHLWQRYIAYLISRSAAHGRANIDALRRGLYWRLSQHVPTP